MTYALPCSRLNHPTTTREDFTHHILSSRGPAATPKEIASHFNVIMMAGAVTTATFLSGVLYYLGHNVQARLRLQDEMRNRFNGPEEIRSKELMECTYLGAVVEEGLRIYPPAGAAHLSRIVPKGGEPALMLCSHSLIACHGKRKVPPNLFNGLSETALYFEHVILT